MFARRASWDLDPNPLTRALEARRAQGLSICDLSETNPTRCCLEAPARALERALAALARDPEAQRYTPDPRGPAEARAAIAAYHGAGLTPEQVVLTAGTSEGYAHLFRLLADPGDRVHVPSPGYPLFEHLAQLEGLEVERYPLRWRGGAHWRIDMSALEAQLDARSRAIVLIHPHNPTGAWVDAADWRELRALAAARNLALVSDEVFADTGVGPSVSSALVQCSEGPLCFVLSGASKVLALPQLKLAWIAVSGDPALRDAALARLEFLADAFLSVSPLVARMLPALLEERAAIHAELAQRVALNRAALDASLRRIDGVEIVPAEAGWAAIVRAADAHPEDEEQLALQLLEREGVLVHPGFFFDLEPFDRAGPCAHWVVGLLLPPDDFARGIAALARSLTELRKLRSS